jgi:hypothetical protein
MRKCMNKKEFFNYFLQKKLRTTAHKFLRITGTNYLGTWRTNYSKKRVWLRDPHNLYQSFFFWSPKRKREG